MKNTYFDKMHDIKFGRIVFVLEMWASPALLLDRPNDAEPCLAKCA